MNVIEIILDLYKKSDINKDEAIALINAIKTENVIHPSVKPNIWTTNPLDPPYTVTCSDNKRRTRIINSY